jgi:hypothetical protein
MLTRGRTESDAAEAAVEMRSVGADVGVISRLNGREAHNGQRGDRLRNGCEPLLRAAGAANENNATVPIAT